MTNIPHPRQAHHFVDMLNTICVSVEILSSITEKTRKMRVILSRVTLKVFTRCHMSAKKKRSDQNE